MSRHGRTAATGTRTGRIAGLAVAVGVGLLLHAGELHAAPQPYTSSGGDVGTAYVLQAIDRILPDDWAIAEHQENMAPYWWSGPEDALMVELEDRSTRIHHPAGFEYHPFIRLYFCPNPWAGSMREVDYYGDRTPAFLLGKNHIFRVFYQSRGMIRWDDAWDRLSVTFDLTRPRIDHTLRQIDDHRLRQRLEQRLASLLHGLPGDIMERLTTIERQGSLIYAEYVATVTAPPDRPGAPPLPAVIRERLDRESHDLSREIFLAFPDVSTIYMRRLCDNRMFDSLIDRDAELAPAAARTPVGPETGAEHGGDGAAAGAPHLTPAAPGAPRQEPEPVIAGDGSF